MIDSAQKLHSRSSSIAFCGLSIAFMAVSAWITVPFGPVPFTLQTLAVMVVLFSLRPKEAFAAIAGYLVLGALGLPVFSSFKGGLAALLGPTGGFILGFLIAGAIALRIGLLVRDKGLFSSDRICSLFGYGLTMGTLAKNLLMGIVFLVVLYAFGWGWLMYFGHLGAEAAFFLAVAPFVAIDAVKMVLAVVIAQAISRAIR